MMDSSSHHHEDFVRLAARFERNVRAFVVSLLPNWEGVDEVMQKASMVMWRKLDQFGPDRPGSNFVDWAFMIARYQVLMYRRKKATDRTVNSRASFVMQPSDFGRWMQLAVVYDGENSMVTHYLDGELLGTARLPTVVPLAIGNAEIGNWTPPPKDSRQIRHFNGRIDEMLTFEGTLSAKEIFELHQNGKP